MEEEHGSNLLGLSDEDKTTRYSSQQLQSMFPNGSGSISSDSFSPNWYGGNTNSRPLHS